MTYKVIQWATGTVGIHAVPGIVAHPKLELAGLWVHSDNKAGQDAGVLCGGEPVGVLATQDADALLALDADCICYTANSDLRPGQVVEDLCRMLASGKNVVNTSFVPLLFPKAAGDGVLRPAPGGLRGGRHQLLHVGHRPGLRQRRPRRPPLALCKEVRLVRMMEIVNYDTWDNPFTMFEIMGFGKPDTSQSLLLAAGLHHAGVGAGARAGGGRHRRHARAASRSTTRSSSPTTTSRSPRAPSPRGRSRACASRSSGSSTASRPSWSSTSPGCATTTRPTGRRAQGYRILIEGEPHLKLELELSSDLGDHNHAGCLATAMHVLNAIPDVVEAAPGVLTMLDLPVYSASVT